MSQKLTSEQMQSELDFALDEIGDTVAGESYGFNLAGIFDKASDLVGKAKSAVKGAIDPEQRVARQKRRMENMAVQWIKRDKSGDEGADKIAFNIRKLHDSVKRYNPDWTPSVKIRRVLSNYQGTGYDKSENQSMSHPSASSLRGNHSFGATSYEDEIISIFTNIHDEEELEGAEDLELDELLEGLED